MKKLTIFLLSVSCILFACSKSGGDSPSPTPSPSPSPTPTPTPTESPIAFTIDIDPGAGNIYGAVGSSQAIKVNVSSTLPTAGVQVDVTTKRDTDGGTVSTSSLSSVAATVNASVDSLKSGVLCTTTVIVTSKGTSTNSLTKTFKIAKK
jgi:hypothetical protein